jgi:hypothetical protein
MKFLVIRRPRAGALVRPTSQMIRAQKEGLLAAVKRGEADCTYAFVGGGGFSILNANSTDEVNQRLFGSPLGFFYEFEVRLSLTMGNSWTPWPKCWRHERSKVDRRPRVTLVDRGR